MRPFLLSMLLLLTLIRTLAQTGDIAEGITAANIHHLHSVAHIDFAAMECTFDTGSFALSTNGEYVAAQDSYNHLYVWDTNGELLYADDLPCDELRNPAHIAFDAHHVLYTVEQVDNSLTVSKLPPLDNSVMVNSILPLEVMVLAVWVEDETLWLEARENNQETVFSIQDVFVETYGIDSLAYAPADDPNAIVRIGRIQPPYTVTSSREGIVTLWNIQTGEVVYEVDNGTGEAAVFGAINSDATHLIWRDTRNESLYLLNFETGANHFIANLDGQYAQWYFLSNDTSVALAVNLNFEPNVVAWDTATGAQTVLGEYRECSRPQPDMARFSADGTTLVIGCDTGLDIWRIASENE
jgi:WD40 repeat protein